MSIVTFWSQGDVETGKTATMAAVATFLSIENNYKILIINTKPGDSNLEDCFWDFNKESKSLFANKNKTDIGTGMEGLAQAILSNKTNANIITNYAKIVFKNSLELLTYKNNYENQEEELEKQKNVLKEIIKIADSYYDLVFLNLEGSTKDNITNLILEISNLKIINLTQSLRQIEKYIKTRQENLILSKKDTITLIGKCDMDSKYNARNIARYIGEKEIFAIPYNTLFFEACSEGKVAELFIKFRKINKTDPNAEFFNSIKEVANKITDKLKELQMRI